MQLVDGGTLVRILQQPVTLEPGDVYYLSFLAERSPGDASSGRFFRVSLAGDAGPPRRRLRTEAGFGVTTEGFPFIKAGGKIVQSAPAIEDATVYLFVGKVLASHERSTETYLRVYRDGEPVDREEPTAWSTVGPPSRCGPAFSRVFLAAGPDALLEIDELKLGTTWKSVTSEAGD